jgi:uncharacterized repeat protein (TIGR01451 family)
MKTLRHLLLSLAIISGMSVNAQLPAGSYAPDFTATDIDGNTHHLYSYLNNGQTVVLCFFATWSSFDYEYFNSGALNYIQSTYGVPGNASMQVIAIEGDPLTGPEDLTGEGSQTQGDYLSLVNFPVIDDGQIAQLYQLNYFPTIYIICPNQLIGNSNMISPEAWMIEEAVWNCGTVSEYSDLYIDQLQFGNPCNDPSFTLSVYNWGTAVEDAIDYTLNINGVVTEHTLTGPFEPGAYITATHSEGLIAGANTIIVELETDDAPWNNSAIATYNVQTPFESTSHVRLDMTTDEFPSDVTWNITDPGNNIVASGGPYYDAFTNIVVDIFLDELGCYSFNLFDSSDNGIDTEENIYLTSVDDWGNSNFFNYDGTYEYGQLSVPFQVTEQVPVSISGYVFADANLNGIMDLEESGIGLIEVHLGDMVTYTNENGAFAFNDYLPDGSQIYIVYDNNAWPVATTPVSYTVNGETTFEFGLNNGTPYFDIDAFGFLEEYFVCNSENLVYFSAYNNSNQAVNLTVTATLDPLLVLIGSEPAGDISANTVTWTLNDFAAGSTFFGYAMVLTPSEEFFGEIIDLSGTFVATDSQGNIVGEGSFAASAPFFCSFDPNGMMANPEGDGAQHYIPNGTQMEYIIQFQNIGNYPAQDVVLQNQLSQYHDFSTFTVTGASHNGQLVYNEQTGAMEYVFHDIFLPGAETDEALSQGYLRYTVDLLPDLADGTVIENEALIIFDENEPIITNQVFNTIGIASSINESAEHEIGLYPNPADDVLFIESNHSDPLIVRIYDATGKLVKTAQTGTGKTFRMQIADLPSGVYQMSAESGKEQIAKTRFVKK